MKNTSEWGSFIIQGDKNGIYDYKRSWRKAEY